MEMNNSNYSKNDQDHLKEFEKDKLDGRQKH